MRDPFAAFEEPPRVVAIDGEVVVTGPLVAAAYTPEAARAKAEMLLRQAEEAERQNQIRAAGMDA
jgi:hypothetical protein